MKPIGWAWCPRFSCSMSWKAKTLECARPHCRAAHGGGVADPELDNITSDAIGFTEALCYAFHVYELGHARWTARNENRYRVGLLPDV